MPSKGRGGKKRMQARSRKNTNRNDALTRGSKPSPLSGSVSNPITVQNTRPLFPLSTRKKLTYYESVALTGTASAVTGYSFSANGCYDPNVSGTGHQPNGFDSMMLYYNHYTVIRSRIKVTIQNRISEVIRASLSVSGTTSYSTNYQNLVENGQLVYVPLSYVGNAGSLVSLRASCDLAKFEGMKYVTDNASMRGDGSFNPEEQAYYLIAWWNPLTSTVPNISLDVSIEYDVMFTEPKKAEINPEFRDSAKPTETKTQQPVVIRR